MLYFESAAVCLAMALYHEARSESVVSQVAVGLVVINRVHDQRYPDDICSVVTQGKRYAWNKKILIKDRCQFSFFCDGMDDRPKNAKAWSKARTLSHQILSGRFPDITEGSTHYHATYVEPDWAASKTKTTQIGSHIFYRWEQK